MSKKYVLILADSHATIEIVGGKGASLARLTAAGLPVPEGFHITTSAYSRFIEANGLQPQILEALKGVDLDNPGTLEEVSQQIKSLIVQSPIPGDIVDEIYAAYEEIAGELPTVAVRSSATAEDLPGMSFAGQQETFLNIEGQEEVLDAVRRCWASLWTARAIGYRAHRAIDSNAVKLAVVVQHMVPAEASGILFTANPMTGDREQLVINAAWGLGEAIVGGEVTPDIVVVDKANCQVVAREIAQKDYMTVQDGNGTTIQSVPADLKKRIVLDDQDAVQLAKLGLQIEELYGMPMDIEWTRVDGQFAIVQARPITALPEPSAPPPEDWPLLQPKGKYMRASIVDFLPDPLSPLFATLGVASYNHSMINMAEKYVNAGSAIPQDLMVTINDYAYLRLDYSAVEWLKLLVLFGFRLPGLIKLGNTIWREEALPEYRSVVEKWENRNLEGLSPRELFDGVKEIVDQTMSFLSTLQIGPLPLPAQSEMIFTGIYDKLIKKEDDPPAPTFVMGFESKPIQGDKELYELAQWCKAKEELKTYLLSTSSNQLAAQVVNGAHPPDLPMDVADDWLAWKERFQVHLAEYAHNIYDLDFAKPTPADEPAPILETFRMYLSGQGQNPIERQTHLAEKREKAEAELAGRLKGIRRWMFYKSLRRAQRLAPIRENGIAEIGLGYPQVRTLLDELGECLRVSGMLAHAEDIYWLKKDEIEQAISKLENHQAIASVDARVQERQMRWRGERKAKPPAQVPPKVKVLGVEFSSMLAEKDQEGQGRTLEGLGASPGKVTAPACILRGPDDFDRLQPGGVLVANITTPAWTPLFARAAAIVTDVGGPLSHGSIVAREYGIPAVLGTGIATRAIRHGELITVDGDAGLITLEER